MVKPRPLPVERRYDRWLVLAMLALTLLDALQGKQGIDQSSSPLNEVAWGVAYLVAAARLFAMHRELRNLLAGSLPLLMFLAICFISTFWSVDPGLTLKNSIELIGTATIALYVVAALRLTEFLDVLAVFFGASALASLALIFVSPGRARMFWGSGPWDGVYEEKNALGAAMALAILVFATQLLRRGSKFKLLSAAGLVLSAILLVGSDSATALLDCVAVIALGTVALACASPSYGGVTRVVALLGALLAVAAATFAGLNPEALYALLGRTQTLSGRADFWPI